MQVLIQADPFLVVIKPGIPFIDSDKFASQRNEVGQRVNFTAGIQRGDFAGSTEYNKFDSIYLAIGVA